MKYNQLGSSDLKVSEICLGTMTWGTQNSESQAHAQMDYALDSRALIFSTPQSYIHRTRSPPKPRAAPRPSSAAGLRHQANAMRSYLRVRLPVAVTSIFRVVFDINEKKIRNSIEASPKGACKPISSISISYTGQIAALITSDSRGRFDATKQDTTRARDEILRSVTNPRQPEI